MNAAGMIKRLSKGQELEITRRSPGQYVEGVWLHGSIGAKFKINCSVQPMLPHMVERLLSGERERAKYYIFSPVELQILNEPDVTKFRGKVYQFATIENWEVPGGYFAYAMLLSEETLPEEFEADPP